MKNNYIGIFDVIGPIMIGPSSSHTSGAARIAWMARQIYTGTPTKVSFTLYGSFAETYLGHGTDRALIGGMLGYRQKDMRIRNAYELAEKAGLRVGFIPDTETEVSHPNTVDVLMSDESGHSLLVRGESIGGGRVCIKRINDIDVEFNGDYSTVIIGHLDKLGMAAFITGCLAEYNINIASLRLFREGRGRRAFTVIESDNFIPEELKERLLQHENVVSVDLIEI